MQQALAKVRSQLGRQWMSSSGGLHLNGPLIESRNPGRPDEVVGRFSSASSEDVEQAVRWAVQTRDSWRDTTTEQRVNIMRTAAALMRTRRDELAAWEIVECGKPWREADADLAEAIDFLEFYAADWHRLASPKRLGHEPGELNERLYSPRGVTAVIAPWNFPLAIPTGMVSAALVTGNPVVFKPSERSPMMGHWLTEILREAGVPEGIVCCLPGGPDIGRALVHHPDIVTIAFTGSKDVGLGILKDAGTLMPGQQMVKRVLAEMGGKNAIIVDETADLDDAITGVVSSFTGYAGQKCSACSRAIVHAAVYESFLDRLKEAVLSLKVGNPEEPGTQVGPVIDRRAQSKIQEYIEIGKKEARLLVEGTVTGPGWYNRADGLRGCGADTSSGSRGNLWADPRGDEGRFLSGGADPGECHGLCTHRRSLFTKPGQSGTGTATIRRRESLSESSDHRRASQPPAVWRPSTLRSRSESRR